eukprot:gnl/Dysnectes_brevis/604_a668_5822.p1 GENE.gnl/Dysnectes_brevis/604_a668_5822~~gnl/Dysnectes_brevis/604_a668_5822.p1  ORF type:complete len:689 (+),score=172.19 gnl/Dysnectes_brevis/604_a668_5822:61-2127(+)
MDSQTELQPVLVKPKDLKDKPIKSAIIEKRKCRDVLCCLIFIAFWFFIGWIIYSNRIFTDVSKIELLYVPIDTFGRVCGRSYEEQPSPWRESTPRITGSSHDNTEVTSWPAEYQQITNMTGYDYLFYLQTTDGALSFSTDGAFCIPSCPTEMAIGSYICEPEWAMNHADKFKYTVGEAATEQGGAEATLFSQLCHVTLYDTVHFPPTNISDILNKMNINRCLPDVVDIMDGLTSTWLGSYAEDVTEYVSQFSSAAFMEMSFTWPYMLGGFAIAIVMAVMWLVFIRLCASLIVWITLLGIVGGLALGAYVLYTQGVVKRDFCEEMEGNLQTACDKDLTRQANLYYYGGIGVGSIAVIFLLLIFCFCGSINLAINIIQVATDCVRQMFRIVFLPLLFIILVIIHVVWSGAALALYWVVAGEFSGDGGKRMFTPETILSWVYAGVLLFAILWGMFFIMSLGNFVISGAIAQWYFTLNREKNPPKKPIRRAVRWIPKHMGSIAIGSFIIALIVWIRIVFEFVQSRLKKKNGESMAKFLVNCIRCCLKCIEKILKYLNRNVFILIAIRGDNYCRSTKKVISYLTSNAGAMIAIQVIGDNLLLLGKFYVALSAGGAVGFVLWYWDITSLYVVPTLLTAIISFLFASMIMSVAELAVDTLFICFLVDREMNDRRSGFAPKKLRRFLEKQDKRENK